MLFASCVDRESTNNQKNPKSLVVGGFRFGISKNEILEVAKSKNYEIIPNGEFNYILKGNIPALGMNWNEMWIMYDEEHGIKQITLSRAYDTVTQEMKDSHFASLSELFPNIEKTPYAVSISCGDFSVKSNFATIYDIKDERKDGYIGSTYFILDKNQFSTNICIK